MRDSTIGWVALVVLALIVGSAVGACWGCWIADREWRECWAEIIRDREDRERDLADAEGELAAEVAERPSRRPPVPWMMLVPRSGLSKASRSCQCGQGIAPNTAGIASFRLLAERQTRNADEQSWNDC